jgi:hypothetical protein
VSKDEEDIGFVGETTFIEHIMFDTSDPFTLILYFGIFTQKDASGDLDDHARSELQAAMDASPETLFREHVDAWQSDIW